MRTYFPIPVRLVALVAGCALFGCGGGGSGHSEGSGGPSGNSGDPGFDRRLAVSKAVSDLYDSLPHTSVDADNRAILDLLRSRPEMEAAGQGEPGSVWGRFQDTGEVFVVVNDGSVTAADLSRAAPPPSAWAARATRAPTELPAGQALLLFNDMGANAALSIPHPTGAVQNAVVWGFAEAHLSNLVSLLRNSDGPNYTGIVKDSGTPVTLKNVVDADGLYIYGHAGYGVARNGKPILVLNTSLPTVSVFSPLTLGVGDLNTYRALGPDIEAGRVGLMMIADGAGGPLTGSQRKLTMKAYYYITPDFVRAYMSFKPQTSFVFINGCKIADPRLGADWMAAFKEKHAGVFLSWDKSTNAFEAMDTADAFFAGITGHNLGKIEFDPPQRSFPYDQIVAQLMRVPRPGAGYSMAQSGGHEGTATLAAKALDSAATFGFLTPSIGSMSVTAPADNQQVLTLNGQFGTTPGRVTIDGTEASVLEWQASRVKCLLPPGDQPGASGDVRVEVNGHKSNAVQLTLWTIKLRSVDKQTYSGTVVISDAGPFSKEILGDQSGTETLTADATFWIRADVHDYHATPGQNPLAKPNGSFMLAPNPRFKTQNAKITTWSLMGTIETDLHYPGERVFDHWTNRFSSSANGPIRFDGSDPRGNGANVSGSVDIDQSVMKLFPFIQAATPGKVTHTDNQGTRTSDTNGSPRFNRMNGPTGPIPLDIRLDSNLGVQAGSFTETYTVENLGIVGHRTISWTGSVSHPPKPDATRSAARRATVPAASSRLYRGR
ncbi:MAG: hypothetical protein IT210_18935 [Armatimonadetes bacterium]|nr:hypothetical protein [Armatimonadota bacterium]